MGGRGSSSGRVANTTTPRNLTRLDGEGDLLAMRARTALSNMSDLRSGTGMFSNGLGEVNSPLGTSWEDEIRFALRDYVDRAPSGTSVATTSAGLEPLIATKEGRGWVVRGDGETTLSAAEMTNFLLGAENVEGAWRYR